MSEDVSCPICGRGFRGGWCVSADEKLYSHMSHGKAHRLLRDELFPEIIYYNDPSMYEDASCLICQRRFRGGGYHSADQKLYSHMSHGKAHRHLRDELVWPVYVYVYV
jgi:hypothetical protein